MNSYDFIIDSWRWSFSRVNYNCLKELKMSYIDCEDKVESAHGQFGGFCHTILEKYFKGELDLFELPQFYMDHFDEYVTLPFPYNKYVDMKEKSFNAGLKYFEEFDFDLEHYELLGIEKQVNFKVGKYNFIGFIDLLLRNKDTGEITILDHKSSSIKILKSGKISKKDEWHFEQFKKQLYLYAIAVLEEYGRVDYLEWNLFKDMNKIKIPFSSEEFEAAKEWTLEQIHKVENEEEWEGTEDFFYCNNLCSVRHLCESGRYYEGYNEGELDG